MSLKNVAVERVVFHDGGSDFRDFRAHELGFTDRGGFVLSIKWPQGGSFFTTHPISNMDWRRKHKTQAAYKKIDNETIVIYDDWGRRFTVQAGPDVIDGLVADCVANEIPEEG